MDIQLYVYGKKYEVRPIRSSQAMGGWDYLLSTDGQQVGTISRVGPNELELQSSSGYYRVNGATLEVLAKRHYEDTTGVLV